MKAARFCEAGKKPLVIEQVPFPELGPKDVLVAVKAAGICGTDAHIAIRGTLPVARSPITLGLPRDSKKVWLLSCKSARLSLKVDKDG